MSDSKTYTARTDQRMTDALIILRSRDLTINDVVQVARFGAQVKLTDEKEILQRVKAAHDYM